MLIETDWPPMGSVGVSLTSLPERLIDAVP